MSQLIDKMPPVFLSKLAYDSSETLVSGAPSLDGLKKWSSQVSELQASELKENIPSQASLDQFKSQTKNFAKLTNPFAAKNNFLSLFEKKSAKIAGQTNNQAATAKKHIARTFGELPLTQESVNTLQSDIRISRYRGTEIGFVAGLGIGMALAIPIGTSGALAGGMGAIAAPIIMATSMATGAVAGAKIGYSMPKNESKLRLHGFYYTGIVASKSKSASIVKFLSKNDYIGDGNLIYPTNDLTNLADKMMFSKLGLSEKEAADVVKYLQFAINGVTVDKK